MQFWQSLQASRATGAALVSVGVFWGGFVAYLPVYKLRAGVSDAALGQALILAAVGGIAAMTFAPRLARGLGRWLLPLTTLVLALAALSPLAISSLATLAGGMLVMGAAMSSVDIGSNVRISMNEARLNLPLMNLNHALFSFGFAGAAASMGLARHAGWPPETALPLLALVLLALAALTYTRADPVMADAPPVAAAQSPWGAILPAAAILFAAFISENATETWSVLHIERSLGGAPGEGAFGPAMLGITMGIGRMAGQALALRLGSARLVAYSACLGVLGALTLALAPVQEVGVLGVALIGLGVAVVVPSANTLLGAAVAADQRAFAISRAWMLGFAGFFIGPVTMGLLAEAVGLRWAFVGVALMLAAILPGLWWLVRR
ncbi:MFS transporter [Phaeovulum sp. W22_SRMD_FR3]|uniref:MFS transporter n=1 Tax=Phaeovulum sp. W22_SRMD_FR3 TaxID=3240274 RepID=UPI003F94E8D2